MTAKRAKGRETALQGKIAFIGSARTLAVLLFIGAVIAVSVPIALSRKGATGQHIEQPPQRVLAPDVESVLTSFSFVNEGGDVRIRISGKSVVRRGRRLLGLRANAVKTNFIEEVRGSYASGKGSTAFSAAQAEWDGDSSRPLILKDRVTIAINGKELGGVQSARIYLKNGVVEVNGSQKYRLR